jgi:hypothetical protein
MENLLKSSAILLMVVCSSNLQAQQKITPEKVEVLTGTLVKVTEPLRAFQKSEKWVDVRVRDENGAIWPNGKGPQREQTYYEAQQQRIDPVIQKTYATESNDATARAIGVNINGIGFSGVNPPDPTICAGPNHVIQMINGNSGAILKIYDKNGNQLVAQGFLDQITGRGGFGDPIALYDQLVDRFVLMEFANSSENSNTEGLIFAVSQTPDPTGSWNVYFYGYGSTLPDYPKVSVWTDAYYCTTNDFLNRSTYTGSSVWAFNKAQMIAGNTTAQSQRITIGNSNKVFSTSPVLLQGTAVPPAGTGGLIAYMADDAWTAATTDVDSIGLLEFDVNFSNPALSSISTRASLATATYNSSICAATRSRCISQPGTTTALESLQSRFMNQPIYRQFSGYEGIVLTHIVNNGSDVSALRWYELRKTSGNWSINQQSTYGPDNTNRWMPSICYDKFGNIALAYNVSSAVNNVFPGIRYTGRKECDPPNTMTFSEDVIVAGTAANGSTRYGDYNHLVADPDGVTFWFTAEWNGTTSWNTRIASFTLDECTTTVCSNPITLTSSSITSSSAMVSWAAVSGATSYNAEYKPASSTTWISAATGTTATSVNITGLAASTLYDWRVRANCSAGSSGFAQAQFTTSGTTPPPTTCPSSFDNVANGAFSNAQTIPLNTDIKGRISPTNDNDYYRFTITTGGTVTITLTTLPADYDIQIFNNAQTQIASSTNGSTTSETLNRTLAAGTYFARVFGFRGANNTTVCYTLKVATGTASLPEVNLVSTGKTNVQLFPNPVKDKINIQISGNDNDGRKNLVLVDMTGRILRNQQVTQQVTKMDVRQLSSGVYFIKVIDEKGIVLYKKRFLKQ